MKKPRSSTKRADKQGLSAMQTDVIFNAVNHVIETVLQADPRPCHFALLIAQLEPESTDEFNIVTTNLISSMRNKEDVHEYLRGWMHRETQ